MKVGFYDAKKHRMVQVEQWAYSLDEARMASVQMAMRSEEHTSELQSH